MRHCPQYRIRLMPDSVSTALALPEFDGPIVLPAGRLASAAHREWLVGSSSTAGRRSPRSASLLVFTRSGTDDWPETLQSALDARRTDDWAAALIVGRGQAAGRLAAACRDDTGFRPIDDLIVMGPGLPTYPLRRRIVPFEAARALKARHPREQRRRERWSRTIGALGLPTWRRLSDLTFGIVGCGRLGSLLAADLVRSGARRLVLADPDRVERHNLGEMDLVGEPDIDRPKADALADQLRAITECEVEAVAMRVDQRRAFLALREVDLLVSCSDDDTARWVTAAMASAYLRPLLDVGTGVFNTSTGRRLGLDVRLVLPDRCLNCAGGAAAAPPVRTVSGSEAAETDEWRRQRAGSLRSLNQVAAGLGQRLIEDLLAGRIRHDVFVTLEFDEHGLPALRRRHVPRLASCPICQLSGIGDDLISLLPGVLISVMGPFIR